MTESALSAADQAGQEIFGDFYNPRHALDEACPVMPGQCLVCWWRWRLASTKEGQEARAGDLA